MNVSACLVTRGDVDMRPVLDSLPSEWEKVVWDNSGWLVTISHGGKLRSSSTAVTDLSVYGRYAAIEYATNDLIYVQDDDVIVDNPSELADVWAWESRAGVGRTTDSFVVCNMPHEFLAHYPDSGLVGFGACFHRDAPDVAFKRWFDSVPLEQQEPPPEFYRRCDNVFTVLTPRVLVDVPKTDREMASDPNRMWKQPGHTGERDRMIDLARRVRDA